MNITDFKMDYFSLEGKNAIITGGNTGLGQAYAVALAKAGANIFIPSVIEDDGETKALIEKEGRKMEFMKIDITENGAPREVVRKCVDTFGTVDILINNAGINPLAPVLEFGRDKWDKAIAVNLTAAFEMSYEAAQVMVPQRSGKIINVCSVFTFLGGQWNPSYAASKHGIAGLTKAYADELGQYNIQVNGIAPGYFATKLTEKTRSNPETNKRVLDHIPANRWGELVDLMGPIVFLSSKASDYVNGHIFVVDGGYLVR
jgi:NAD(P)-dependent dehydrogenase (short-subunit alcohol dehydrogenase family)